VPALPPYLIEPIWQQLEALLPEREVSHPLGCHRPRIPDRVVFEKLVQVLVFGCAYERIADQTCSATTLRDRRDEWIELGVMDRLREMVLEIYDRFIGLEVSEMAVDCCITKAPCGGEKAGRNPVDRGKQGTKRSMAVDERGIPLGAVSAPANRHDSPLLVPTLDAVAETLGTLPGNSARGDQCPPRPWLRLRSHPRAPGGSGAIVGDLQGRQAGPFLGHEEVGGGEDECVAQRPQEVGVVHGAGGEGDRLLGDLLGGGDHREETDPGSLEPLPLGKPTASQTMTYPRRL
jgi:transposase